MDWIFLDLTEAEIGGIYWPVIWTHFLLSRIVVLVGFQVQLSNFLCLWHVLCRINSFFDTPFIGLSCKTESELFFICLFREAILSINCTSERLSLQMSCLPFERIVFITFLKILNERSNAFLVTCSQNIVGSFALLGWDSIGESGRWQGLSDQSWMHLYSNRNTMVTPHCSLKDLRYFFMPSGVARSRSAGCRHICAETPKVSFFSPA